MRTLTSVEAQNRFGELLDAAQREPVTVTRRGRPVAFVVSPQDMREVLDARNQRSKAVAEFEAWSVQARKHAKPAANKLTQEQINELVREAR
ncbi:MAG TPA: type II toxin-antitoxin system Phd/YefM family antitoxin [Rhodanobacteraceae bacterium]|nr:type II toxin-antitoxin system Phd/YefM family antitoxin [Rhodanobacteraceae bacterium]